MASRAWMSAGASSTQGVQMAGLNVDLVGGPPQYYLDSWDGYPAARTRVVDALAESGAKGPIVLPATITPASWPTCAATRST